MAVKIFCNVCNKFIRDAKISEMKIITGSEICQECEKRLEFKMHDISIAKDNAVKDIESVSKQFSNEVAKFDRAVKSATHQISQVHQRVKAEIEQAIKKVIEPEKADDPQ